MKIRAKLKCEGVVMFEASGCEVVTLRAVHERDSGANKSWSEATPSGSVCLTISNKAAHGAFQVGKDYLVSFEPFEDGAGE